MDTSVQQLRKGGRERGVCMHEREGGSERARARVCVKKGSGVGKR